MIAWGKTAGNCTDGKAGKNSQNGRLSVEPVNEKCPEKSEGSCTEGIGGNNEAELLGGNFKESHDLRPEGHHYHEIHNVDKLYCC